MNNIKASNAIVALADALGSLAQDYEGQVAQLRQSNETLVKQMQGANERESKTKDIVSGVIERLVRRNEPGPHESNAEFCQGLVRLLQQLPWPIVIPNPIHFPSDGSSGPLPSIHTSKASTPSV